jgi:hypothetical protein
MMRLVQKFDKFDTNNQKSDQISKFDDSYQKSNIYFLGVNFFFILTNQGREHSPYAILYCILKWNGL